MQKKDIRPTIATVIVALFPVGLWLITQPLAFASTGETLNTLGKLCAIAGFSLFGWNIFLSTRLTFFEKLYGGLPNLYRWHHITGSWAFMLLLIHPTLITLRYSSISLAQGYQFLKPSLNFPQLAGEASLAIMYVAILVSIYISIKHEWFVKLQIILGLVFFLGAYHGFFIAGSDVSQSSPLIIFGTVWVLLALTVIAYRSIFHKSFRKRWDYTIQSAKKKADLLQLDIISNNGIQNYAPGQFAFIKVINTNLPKQYHPFSITSVPTEKHLQFGIKQLGDYTNALSSVQAGDSVSVEGPYGEFGSKLDKYTHQVWIAGGIGITPFISMAKALNNQSVDLYYSFRSNAQAYFVDELKTIAKAKTNFRLHLINSENHPQFSANSIAKHTLNTGAAIWICGPPRMMKAIKNDFVSAGVKSNQIITEEFALS